jgi:hypothetical protein
LATIGDAGPVGEHSLCRQTSFVTQQVEVRFLRALAGHSTVASKKQGRWQVCTTTGLAVGSAMTPRANSLRNGFASIIDERSTSGNGAQPPLHFRHTGRLFDALRQFFVSGSNFAHRLLSVHIVHGFGSRQDLASACSQVPRERKQVDIYHCELSPHEQLHMSRPKVEPCAADLERAGRCSRLATKCREPFDPLNPVGTHRSQPGRTITLSKYATLLVSVVSRRRRDCVRCFECRSCSAAFRATTSAPHFFVTANRLSGQRLALPKHVTQVVDGTNGIHGMIPRAIITGQ